MFRTGPSTRFCVIWYVRVSNLILKTNQCSGLHSWLCVYITMPVACWTTHSLTHSLSSMRFWQICPLSSLSMFSAKFKCSSSCSISARSRNTQHKSHQVLYLAEELSHLWHHVLQCMCYTDSCLSHLQRWYLSIWLAVDVAVHFKSACFISCAVAVSSMLKFFTL